MLEYVEQGDEVVGIALEHRQIRQPRVLDLASQALAGERAGAAIEFARFDFAEPAEHREIVPGAAPDLEDASSLRWQDHAFDQAVENASAREEPPMFLVKLGHPVEHRAFHASSTPRCRGHLSRQEVKVS